MIVQQVKCDVCGIIKGESNHWFNAGHTINDSVLTFFSESEGLDICSESCAHKLLSEWLENLRKSRRSKADSD